MNTYEQKIYQELKTWRRKVLKKSGLFTQISKRTQTKINGMIPERAHRIITESIKNMVKATLIGSNITTKKQQSVGLSLSEKDQLLQEKLTSYRKTAVIEGAGTGAGGIFLGLADFSMLLSIYMKFLYVTNAIYGYDTHHYEEGLFIRPVYHR